MNIDSSEVAVDRALTRLARTTDQVVTLSQLRERLLSGRQLVMKYGVDLTAPHLHLGHAVNLWAYRELQELGHRCVLLLGDFTTRIGDPTGKSKTRPVLTAEEIQTNADAILKQALTILIDDPSVLEVRRNSEWLNTVTPAQLLTTLSQVTVERLLSRDMFRRRMQGGSPIAVNEFLYPVLQGWDSVCLQADLTIIGTDQLFNEMIGRYLQERQSMSPQVVMTTKITPGLDGIEKQSKSLGNYVAVDHAPREKFGRLMRLPDHLVREWLLVYSDLGESAIDRIIALADESPIATKLQMAKAIVARYHGSDTASEELQWFESTFSRRETPSDVPVMPWAAAQGSTYDLARQALDASFSNAQVRRLITQGGVEFDGEKLQDLDQLASIAVGGSILKIGKRRWFRVIVQPATGDGDAGGLA